MHYYMTPYDAYDAQAFFKKDLYRNSLPEAFVILVAQDQTQLYIIKYLTAAIDSKL